MSFDGELGFNSSLSATDTCSEAYAALVQGLGSGQAKKFSAKLERDLKGVDVHAWRKDLVGNGVSPKDADVSVARLRALQSQGLPGLLTRIPGWVQAAAAALGDDVFERPR